MKFKLDENLPVEAANLLRDGGYDALTVADQNLEGERDPTTISVCMREERALITLDLDFSDIRTYPPNDYPGIIILRIARHSRVRVLSVLRHAMNAFDSEKLAGCLWVVTESRIRIHGQG